MKKGNPIALLPIGVFLVLYLGLGLLFEYGLHIPMGLQHPHRHRVSRGHSGGLSSEPGGSL